MLYHKNYPKIDLNYLFSHFVNRKLIYFTTIEFNRQDSLDLAPMVNLDHYQNYLTVHPIIRANL